MRPRTCCLAISAAGVLLVLGTTACPETTTQSQPVIAPLGYDGSYAGSWSGGQSNGATATGQMMLVLANGAVQGTVAPFSGSMDTFSGTVSSSGAISATIPSAPNGCAISLAGQAATLTTGGATTATITGTYALLASVTCKTATGTWNAVRK